MLFFLCSGLKMNLWLLLALTVLANCQKRVDGQSCPRLCSCSFSSSGAEVVCSHSSLNHFPADGLPASTTLLAFQSTNLSTVAASDLSAVPFLSKLQLYHNSLKSLPSDLLRDVPRLATLDLTGNQLAHLPPDVFNHTQLHSLVLKTNLIEKLDAEWFTDNSSLTWVDLSENRLADIPSTLFHKLPHVKTLDLSYNNLQDLQPEALNHLHSLESLNLAGNKLKTLQPTTFTNTLKLSQLFLQENQLQELPPTLFQGLQHLEFLLLNQNQLQHLPSGLLGERNSAFQVTLTGNPWVCDDKIEYLWRWVNLYPENVLFLDEVTCSSPETLKNRKLLSLTEKELGVVKEATIQH